MTVYANGAAAPAELDVQASETFEFSKMLKSASADATITAKADVQIDVKAKAHGDCNHAYTPKPAPEVEGDVEVTQGRIWGDPHFVGADGGKYDVQGEAGKSYNILSDTGIQMNAKFKQWTNPGQTVVEKVGITTGDKTVTVNKDGSVDVNGDAVSNEDGSYHDGLVTIKDGKVNVAAGEYKVEFSQFRHSAKAGEWINNIEIRSKNANSDHVLPSGLWGVTVDGDGKARNGDSGKGTQGGGAIETVDGKLTERGDTKTVKDYEVADIRDTGFDNFNIFAAQGGNANRYGPDLIANGGFEQHGALNRGSWGTLDKIEGWSAKGGQFEIQEGNHHSGTPTVDADEAVVELDAHGHESNGGIEQTVHVEKAGIHELTFDYSPRTSPNGTADTSKMNVVVNGNVVDTITSDKVGFETSSYKLHLPAGENSIAFTATGTEDSYGALLDNVSLKRVPEAQQPQPAQAQGVDVSIGVQVKLDVQIEARALQPELAMDPIKVDHGRIWGDPHFVGADGGKYDVQGAAGKTYNILSDAGVQMNATFKEWNNPGTTVVEAVGLSLKGNAPGESVELKVAADGTLSGTRNGADAGAEELHFDGEGSYLDGAVTINEKGHITVKAGEYDIEFNEFRSNAKAGDWINNITLRSDNAVSDNVLPDGLWGTTVDGDGHARNGDVGKGTQGGGAIETLTGEITQKGDTETVKFYEVDGLFDTNFDNFNQFNAGEKPDGAIDIKASLNMLIYLFASFKAPMFAYSVISDSSSFKVEEGQTLTAGQLQSMMNGGNW